MEKSTSSDFQIFFYINFKGNLKNYIHPTSVRIYEPITKEQEFSFDMRKIKQKFLDGSNIMPELAKCYNHCVNQIYYLCQSNVLFYTYESLLNLFHSILLISVSIALPNTNFHEYLLNKFIYLLSI